jgi:hypothetical protein
MQFLSAQPPAAHALASTFAQYLVDSTVARPPELLELDVHATPPGSAQSAGSTQSEIIAARSADRIGHKSYLDDLEVPKMGLQRVEINRAGDYKPRPDSVAGRPSENVRIDRNDLPVCRGFGWLAKVIRGVQFRDGAVVHPEGALRAVRNTAESPPDRLRVHQFMPNWPECYWSAKGLRRSVTLLTEKLDAVQVEFSVAAYIQNKIVRSLAGFALRNWATQWISQHFGACNALLSRQ